MSRKLTLELPDDAFDSLSSAAQMRGASLETFASKLLTDRFSGPLIGLFGCIDHPHSDVAERHHEYVSAGVSLRGSVIRYQDPFEPVAPEV